MTLHTPPVIALHGFAQAGKDSIAEILREYPALVGLNPALTLVTYGYQRLAFADPIRDAVYALDPFLVVGGEPVRLHYIVDNMGWDNAKSAIPEVRRLLQVFGTEVGREQFGQDVWARKVIGQVAQPGRYVITDLRFQSEYDALAQALGGDVLFVKVKRPGVGPVNGHASDKGLDDDLFDIIINNDGTLKDLKRQTLARLGIQEHTSPWSGQDA